MLPKILFHYLNFTPHPGQEEVLSRVADSLVKVPDTPRFLDVVTGRQWGKTMAAEAALWMALTQPNDKVGPPNIKVIADTYEHANLIWDMFVGHLYGVSELSKLLAEHIKDRSLIRLITGAQVQKLSADNPAVMAGHTLTMAIVDEAAFVQDEAVEILLPCLAIRQGTLLAFGTAEGAGWHRTWWMRGQDGDYPDHWSVAKPSIDSPYFPESALKSAELMLPSRRYRQLYWAEWQAEAGAVFHNIDGCLISGTGQEPEEGKEYLVGVDYARLSDFTVIIVIDIRTGRCVHFDRFTTLDWSAQVERVARVSERYNKAAIAPDASGMGGDILVEAMRNRGLVVHPYILTPQSKDRLVQRLVVDMEREQIRFPQWPQLLRELRVYETRKLPSGRDVTGAPPGYHDDCVIALALANYYRHQWGGENYGESRLKVETYGWSGM